MSSSDPTLDCLDEPKSGCVSIDVNRSNHAGFPLLTISYTLDAVSYLAIVIFTNQLTTLLTCRVWAVATDHLEGMESSFDD